MKVAHWEDKDLSQLRLKHSDLHCDLWGQIEAGKFQDNFF